VADEVVIQTNHDVSLMTTKCQARGQPGDNTACPILLRPCRRGSGTFELVAGNAQLPGEGAENLEGDDPVDLPIDLTGNVNAMCAARPFNPPGSESCRSTLQTRGCCAVHFFLNSFWIWLSRFES